MLFAVSFHKLPEGLALALLLGAGYARSKAFWLTLAIESAAEAGALLGLAALRHAPLSVLGLIFANVGGGFVYEAAKRRAHTRGRNTVCGQRHGGVYSHGNFNSDAEPAVSLASPRKNKSVAVLDSA